MMYHFMDVPRCLLLYAMMNDVHVENLVTGSPSLIVQGIRFQLIYVSIDFRSSCTISKGSREAEGSWQRSALGDNVCRQLRKIIRDRRQPGAIKLQCLLKRPVSYFFYAYKSRWKIKLLTNHQLVEPTNQTQLIFSVGNQRHCFDARHRTHIQGY